MEQQHEAFVFTGQDISEFPDNITHVRCDSSVTEIPEKLFENCRSLVTVELNEGLKLIGNYAFCGCASLVTVELNEGLKRIGDSAFYFCTSLRSINFPSTLEVIGEFAFLGCESLVNVELNEGLKVIGQEAFNFCTALRNINFPSTLEVIERYAFNSCHYLVTVELNEGLRVIGNRAFWKCTSLTSINFPSTLEKIEKNAFQNCRSLVTAELNEGLKVIEGYAFYDCSSLRNINFPSSLEEIGNCSFYTCKRLVNAELNEGLKAIGEYAFARCTSLTSMNFPSTLEEIGTCAFIYCENLESLELPSGLEVIRVGVFYKCKSLKRLFVPSTVKKIKKGAFGLCLKLESVELPEGLEEIGDGAFYACDELRNVSIPSTFTKLGRIFTYKEYEDYEDEEDEDEEYGFDDEQTRAPRHLALLFSEDDEDFTLDMRCALKTRFHNLPIHELCYYQSHNPTAATLHSLQHIVSSKGISFDICDVYGMSPFHILALSTKPNIELFRALMELFPTNFLHKQDALGCCPIEYLLCHGTSDVNSMVKQLLVDRIKWLGLERWRAVVMNEIQNFPEGFESLNERKQQLKSIYSTLAKYERFEVLSLLEEFLWSMKLDEAKSTESDILCGEERTKKKAKIHEDSNKQAYRINCGADIVLSNVLPYLGEYCEEGSTNEEESVGGVSV